MSLQIASFQYVSPVLTGGSTQNIISVIDPWRFDLPNGQDCLIRKISMYVVRLGTTNNSTNPETANGQVAFNSRFRLQSVTERQFVASRGISLPVIEVEGDTALGVMNGTKTTHIALSYLNPTIDFPCGIIAGRVVFSTFGFYIANVISGNTQFNVDFHVFYEMI